MKTLFPSLLPLLGVFVACQQPQQPVQPAQVEEVSEVLALVDTPEITAPPDALTKALPADVMESLTSRNTRIGIMARYEGTTDIPEHAFLVNDTTINWDLRARGLGGTLEMPFSTCAEENILAYQIDKYHAEDIMIHEFAHTIHNVGIAPIHPEFNDELQAALDDAVSKGRWKNVYASTNIEEYWAEGVQNWFNVNAEVNNDNGDGKHNKVNTREELKRYDPGLYAILAKYFPEVDKQISRHKKVNLYDVGQ